MTGEGTIRAARPCSQATRESHPIERACARERVRTLGDEGLANLARFRQPDYDRLYDASKKLRDGPERAKLMRQMSEIVAGYAPWKLNAYRYENMILYPWVEGYKLNVFNIHPWQYLDVDAKMPRKSVQ